MKSMTGFGAATAVREGTRVTVELSAVNSKKSAELRFMVPREISTTIESVLRPVIQKKVARGSLTVVVRYELGAALRLQQVVINEDAMLAVIAHMRELAAKTGLSPDIRLGELLAVPGVIHENADLPGDLLGGLALEAFESAWKQFESMQVEEGKALAVDLTARLDRLEALRRDMAASADQALLALHQKLRDRIRLLGLELGINDERLAKEVAFCAERADVNEELVRLESHLAQFRGLLESSDQAVGRQLEFLCQEIGREVNTLGAKAADTTLSRLALDCRAELDRFSEQVKNVE